ncbi:MAG: 4'-phosphopantetheinyl transferase superfamily protein [Kiritimatiellales bacterium]
MNDFSQSIHVWNIFLPDICITPDECRPLLSGAELERAGKFSSLREANRFITGRGLLRKILGSCLNENPAALELIKSPQGKPLLMNGELNFNVSHSRDRMLIAVTAGRAVGIDIEFRREQMNVQEIAERWFTPAEQKFFAENSPAVFFDLWAKKEAYAKARSTGIFRELKKFSVPTGEAYYSPAVSADKRWFFQLLDIDPAYAAAVVAEAPAIEIKVLCLNQ